jgi:long-chain acyl-CoA synthetase
VEGPDLSAHLTATAARLPDRPALLAGDEVVTYGALEARVDAAAAALQRRGVAHGDRVAVMLPNTPAFVEAFYATLRCGAAVVPLNTGYTAGEVGHILGDSGAVAVVTAPDSLQVVSAAREGLPALSTVIVVGEPADGADAAWDGLLAGATTPQALAHDPEDLAAVVYTSGTTGSAKGAMLTQRNLAANQEQVLGTPLAIREGDVVLGVLPLFHIYAMNVGLGTSVRIGATLALVERFDPVGTLAAIEAHQVTVLLGAPPMYVAWLDAPGSAQRDLSSVRVAVSGAAPLPAEVLRRFDTELGVTIWEGYGLTEASPAVTTTAMSEVAKPGSVGRPLPGVEVRLVDERGRDVERGDPGEVWVRGDNVFAGYYNDADATAEVLSDGWLRTGDVGVIDDDGDLQLVDRKRDLIIVSGFNVYPREVEEVLFRHPGVADAAVVGVPHAYTGEAVKAVVVARPGSGLTVEDVSAHCRTFLARFKCPEVVELVDRLPYTVTGKVKRRELRA